MEEYRQPPGAYKLAFEFTEAISQLWNTPGGARFGWRLLGWTSLFIFAVMLGGVLLLAKPYGELFVAAASMDPNASPAEAREDLRQIMDIFGKLAGPFLLVGLGSWFAAVAGEAALHRKALHGTEAERMPLRFGIDELRIIGAQLLLFLFVFGIYIGAIIIGILTLGIGFLVTIPGMIFLIIYVPIIYATAGALSVRDGAFRFNESKAVTKNRRGAMFGAYVFIWVTYYIGITVLQALAFNVLFGGGYGELIRLEDPDAVLEIVSTVSERFQSPITQLLSALLVGIYSAGITLFYLVNSGVGTYTLRVYERLGAAQAGTTV